MNTCPFIMECWEHRGQKCNVIITSTHQYCRFHSSLRERFKRHLGNPRWALAMRPTQEESTCIYDTLPKEENSSYQIYEKELENFGDPDQWETEYDEDSLEPFPFSITDENRHRLVMPTDTCRHKILMGAYQAFYCCQDNLPGSDFCTFHTSCQEWSRSRDGRPSRRPIPIWADCIIPTLEDSKLVITAFPWRSYNYQELMFFEIDPRDMQSLN